MNNLYNSIYWNWYIYCDVFLCVLVSTFFALCFEFNMTSIYRHNCLLALLTPQFIRNKLVQRWCSNTSHALVWHWHQCQKGRLTSVLTTFFGEGDLWCGYHKLLSLTKFDNSCHNHQHSTALWCSVSVIIVTIGIYFLSRPSLMFTP